MLMNKYANKNKPTEPKQKIKNKTFQNVPEKWSVVTSSYSKDSKGYYYMSLVLF